MGQRGKKSSASLSVVAPVQAITRPDAPRNLTVEQAAEWDAVVSRMPADWFPRETHALLAQYCRHVVSAARVSDLIESIVKGETESDNWVADYDRLLKMQEREGRAISSLATRMRISQQSTFDKEKKKGTSRKRPWET